MKLLIDAQLPMRIANLLDNLGYDVIHTYQKSSFKKCNSRFGNQQTINPGTENCYYQR